MKQPRVFQSWLALLQPCFSDQARLRKPAPIASHEGYDPVAYFTEQRPMVGNAQYSRVGRRHLLVCVGQDLELFKADPDRFLPQYNNWWRRGDGEKVHGNPEWWLVVDGRLYLFGKPIGPGMMKVDPAAMKSQADENWLKVHGCRPTGSGLHAWRVNKNSGLTSRPPSTLPVDMRVRDPARDPTLSDREMASGGGAPRHSGQPAHCVRVARPPRRPAH